MTEDQIGCRSLPAEDPTLFFRWHEILENLTNQLAGKPRTWGQGQTAVSNGVEWDHTFSGGEVVKVVESRPYRPAKR